MSDKPNRTPGKGLSDSATLAITTTAKVGLGLLGAGPIGDAAVDYAKERVNKAREAMLRESAQRVDEFFASVFAGEAMFEEDVARAFLDDADFHALLRACVADIEAEKTSAYSCMARAIATHKVDPTWRRHFILSLRDVGVEELECLRHAAIAQKNDLIPPQGSRMDGEEFLKAGLPGSRQALLITNLESRGFVHDGKLSATGIAFTNACWRAEHLTAGSIGYRTWRQGQVLIATYQLGTSEVQALSIAIQERLRVVGFRSNIAAVTRTNVQQLRFGHTVLVILRGPKSKQQDENHAYLKQLAEKIPTLVVDLPGADTNEVLTSARGRLDAASLNTTDVADQISEAVRRL
jgi:hypothetical protein